MRRLVLGMLAAAVAGLTWLSLRTGTGPEVTLPAEPAPAPADPEPAPGQADRPVEDGPGVEAAAPAAVEGEDPQQLHSAEDDAEDQLAEPEDPYRAIRRKQFALVLDDYDEATEIEKSSKLSALVAISVAVLLEERGLFDEASSEPRSWHLQEGVRGTSINGRDYRFTDEEFPEYWTVMSQHLSLSREARTSPTYKVPPEIEDMAMQLAERAQLVLRQ
jgi:hypothetical protein